MAHASRAVVTGGGSGLGQAFCQELVRRGARVVVADVDEAAAKRVAQSLGAAAVAARCDVSVLAEVEALAALAERELGSVDLVINNAGVAVGGKVGDVPISDWQWLIGVNLWGVIHGCHVFVPKLRAARRGTIINVASIAGLAGFPLMAPYVAAKFGVVGLSESLRGELAGDGVSVTVVCPGFFKTNIFGSARLTGVPREEQSFQAMLERQKLSAADVARLALDGAARGKLHVVPQADAKFLWRLKRLLPQGFHGLMHKAMARDQKKAQAAKTGGSATADEART
jgi:NAD(P)-dependent dehydrogenase (short-subunit alcohol dehydrogenase family)